ncbi:MAG: c-type cytochrome [Terricaulis sp.]
MIRILLLGAVLALSACAAPVTGPPAAREAAVADESLVQDGRSIAEAQCAECHAVGEYGESPNLTAPPFRAVLYNFRPEALEEDLIAGVRVAHAMPDFQFNPQGAGALIAYLKSIRGDPPFGLSAGAELDALANDGRAIAEAQCARCHAVGEYGESPNPAAPVFRTLLTRYRADVLEEELIAGIRVAHPMPEFQFNPQGADALIMYLQYIQERPAAPAHAPE